MRSNFSDTKLLKKTGPDTCRHAERRFLVLRIEEIISTNRRTHQWNFPIRHQCWPELVFRSPIDNIPDVTLGDKS